MAGKIIADQIEHSTAGSLDTSYVVNGSAKAWVNFNGTGTIATRDSLNVSGLVDNGTGDYTVNINNGMLNASYAVSVSSSSGAMSNTDTMINPYVWATGSVSVGSNNNSGSATDRSYLNFAIHGDLA